ncbi:MAG: hypothetical protein DFNUSKGM_001095 [Candidatus Fervidibacter sacchari]
MHQHLRWTLLLLLFPVIAVLVSPVFGQKGSQQKPDPLAALAYPKAKKVSEHPAVPGPVGYVVYETSDPFEKVWRFYAEKVFPPGVKPPSLSLLEKLKETIKEKAEAMLGKPSPYHAKVTNPTPGILRMMVTDPSGKTKEVFLADIILVGEKIGVFLRREENQSLHITICQREKKTVIVITLEKRSTLPTP